MTFEIHPASDPRHVADARPPRGERGIGLVEVVLALTLGSVVMVAVAGTWGSFGLWSQNIGDRAVLLREARAAREYLERDLLAGEVLETTTLDRLHVQPILDDDSDSGTPPPSIEYRRRGSRLERSVRGRARIPIAGHLEAVEFSFDPGLGRARARLDFRAKSSRLRLVVRAVPANGLTEDES